jgi:tetratricopeptide (TPR) repeat protein/TolB-like protein
MATVYRALDHRLDRTVALKVLRPELTQLLGADRFHREIKIAAALQHSNIVGLYEAGEEQGLLYYTMPLVEGETLRNRLEREGQLPVDDAVRISEQIAAALGCAHDHGIIHRDIKPENILLAGDRVMVADFGIARAISEAGADRLTSAGIAIGTPAYMSPEQGSATAKLDGRADIYALGCVLYEMLSGEPPFTGPTAQAVVARQMHEAPRSLRVVRPAVSPALQDVVEKALAKVPADRYATAGDMGAALELAKQRPGRIASLVGRWLRRRAVAPVAAVSVLALAAVVALVVRSGRSRLDPTIVVVAPFESHIADTALAQLGMIAADWVVQVLQATGEIKVVPMAQVAATKWLPGARVQDLAVATGAGTVIAGRASIQGDSVYLRADVVDGRSGALLHSVPPAAAGRGQPLEAVKELARRVGGAAALVVNPQIRDTSMQLSPPSSYEVYREWMEGARLGAAGDWQRAYSHFLRAYTLDTNFVPPLIGAANARNWLGEPGVADSLLEIVERKRDRLTRLEQMNLEGFRAELAGDYQRAAAADREEARLSRTPGNYFYHALLANHPAEALQALERVNADWSPVYCWVRGSIYHVLGRHQDELKAVQLARHHSPGSLIVVNAELRALAALGREKEVFRLLDESRGMEREASLASVDLWGGGGAWVFYETALELRAHGHRGAYRRVIEQALNQLRAPGARDPSATTARWQRAMVLYGAERWEEARASYAALLAADPKNVEFLGGLGVSQARLGHSTAAAALAGRLAAINPPYSFGRSPFWRARIAALLGDRDGAVALLQQALARGIACTYHLGPPTEDCHREMDFESLRGYGPFDELLRPKG